MPNIATVLKTEIARVARKEARAETDALKKASSHYRSAIALLRRQIAGLEKQVRQLSRRSPAAATPQGDEEGSVKVRFSAQRLAAHRTKLGLSAEVYGSLVGVTGQSIYKWEAGKARPRASQLQALAALRKLGKREVAARLAA
jgi:DNA-binding transcriptional regulator YiaG